MLSAPHKIHQLLMTKGDAVLHPLLLSDGVTLSELFFEKTSLPLRTNFLQKLPHKINHLKHGISN